MKLVFRTSELPQTSKAAPVLLLAAGCLWAVACAVPLTAAEVRFRPHVSVDRPLVVLGDIAEIASNDGAKASALASLELFPAPAGGRSRQLYAREIRELLTLRGINLVNVRFSGSSVVQVKSVPPAAPPAAPPTRPAPPLDSAAKDQIQTAVATAIEQYLGETVDPNTPWAVTVRLNDLATDHLSRTGCRFSVSGGSAPFSGSQRFVVSAPTDDGTVDLPVLATVARPELVVVATRAIPTGHIIRPSDVRLQHTQQSFRAATAATQLENVIGKQTTRALAVDHPIDHRAVRAPILVQRGEAVTVSVRVANVKVTTSARAMENGSQGDLIEVQSLNSRERYLAQVTGVQAVAVYPRRVQVAASADNAPEPDSPKRRQIRSAEPLVAVGHTPVRAASEFARAENRSRIRQNVAGGAPAERKSNPNSGEFGCSAPSRSTAAGGWTRRRSGNK